MNKTNLWTILSSYVPTSWKFALSRSTLKKPGLEVQYENFTPGNNRKFVSKKEQLDSYSNIVKNMLLFLLINRNIGSFTGRKRPWLKFKMLNSCKLAITVIQIG